MLHSVVRQSHAMALLTLAGVAVVVFVLVRVVPGDPDRDDDPAGRRRGRHRRAARALRPGRADCSQFLIWVRARSPAISASRSRSQQDVTGVIFSRLPATLELAVAALMVAVALGGGSPCRHAAAAARAGETAIDAVNGYLACGAGFHLGARLRPAVRRAGAAACRSPGASTRSGRTGFHDQILPDRKLPDLRFAVAADILAHMVMPAIGARAAARRDDRAAC